MPGFVQVDKESPVAIPEILTAYLFRLKNWFVHNILFAAKFVIADLKGIILQVYNRVDPFQLNNAIMPERIEKPLCLECREEMKAGREDRKFCSDSCRTAFNNKKRKSKQLALTSGEVTLEITDYIGKVQQILLKNRQILHDLCPHLDDVMKMQKRDLEGRGFNFKYFTSIAPVKAGQHVYTFCFELGYRILTDEVIIVNRPREVVC